MKIQTFLKIVPPFYENLHIRKANIIIKKDPLLELAVTCDSTQHIGNVIGVIFLNENVPKYSQPYIN